MAKDDLIPFDRRSEDEARELGRRGGIASGKARLKKKRGRELVRALLEMGVTDQKVREDLLEQGFTEGEIDNEIAVHLKQIQKAAASGDTAAYNSVMKVAGYVEEKIQADVDLDWRFKFGGDQ